MRRKRDRLKIMYDILKVISEKSGRIKPTHILYKSNLSPVMLEEYLKELISKRLVAESASDKGKTYAITGLGKEYIDKYSVVVDFMESFGLDEND